MLIGPRLPLQSIEPVLWFARIRMLLAITALAATALAATLALEVPHKARAAVVIAVVAVGWSLSILELARRVPQRAMTAFVAIGDLLVLAVIPVVEPEAYAAVRFVALFFIATHAYFLGERNGLAIALACVLVLVPAAALLDVPVQGGTLAFDEVHQLFVHGRHGTPVDVAIDAVGIVVVATFLSRREC